MRIIVWILLLFLPIVGYGQNQKSFSYNADVLVRNYRIKNSERTLVQPGFSIGKDMHHLRLAPIIQMYSSEARNEIREPSFTGFSLAYHIQIPSAFSFLDQHFELESSTQFFNTNWKVNKYIESEQNYERVAFESRESFQSFTLGYGFFIRPFGDHFYIRQTTGVGMFFSNVTGGPVSRDDVSGRIDFRGYGDFEAMLSISAGLGWEF